MTTAINRDFYHSGDWHSSVLGAQNQKREVGIWRRGAFSALSALSSLSLSLSSLSRVFSSAGFLKLSWSIEKPQISNSAGEKKRRIRDMNHACTHACMHACTRKKGHQTTRRFSVFSYLWFSIRSSLLLLATLCALADNNEDEEGE